jgi:predicted flap endonuclease-1-like 5' DNA nuclease
MPEITPREKANATLNASRELIASFRAKRREASAKVAAERAPRRIGEQMSREQRGTSAELSAQAVEHRTWEAERLRREATRVRLIKAAEIKRLREVRWEIRQERKSQHVASTGQSQAPATEPVNIANRDTLDGLSADRKTQTFPSGFDVKVATPHDTESLKKGVASAIATQTKRKSKGAETGIEVTLKQPIHQQQDIDVISGLGSALKAKLRRLGVGTIDSLAEQQPDLLRKQLGPVGRLVNIESLIQSAQVHRQSIATPRSAARGAVRRSQ